MKTFGAHSCGVARVAVIGAGSMGGGIAAQFANAGIPVDLLDITQEAAAAGIQRQIKSGGFMTPGAARHVVPGRIDGDLTRLSQSDWIVEAVTEDLAVKRDLFARIEEVRRAGCIISSNTSTLRRSDLIGGMGEAFDRDFVITHFFNPPRHMRLMELVTGPQTSPDTARNVRLAARVLLGKTVVECRDTPGFIANRIGCFWMACAALEAERLGLEVELADAVMARLGIPRTGVFGLFDIVGIDLVPHVWGSLLASLPKDDALHGYDLTQSALFASLIQSGRHGRKTGAGFYRRSADGLSEALDLQSGAYRPKQSGAILPGEAKDLAGLLGGDGKVGDYARKVHAAVVAYARQHAPAIAEDPEAVDTAVELGYGWKQGPFKLAKLAGMPAPHAAHGAAGDRLLGNDQASLCDMGDGVACFRIHTKMNALAPGVFDALEQTLSLAGRRFDALVLGNDDPRAFSVGADLAFILSQLDSGNQSALEAYVTRGQALFLAMRRAEVPVVAAAHGFALGGGCEFMLHAHKVVAHAELNAGLPETKVGLIPAWGGCTTLLMQASDKGGGPVHAARAAFAPILAGAVSGSAAHAAELGLIAGGTGRVMHRDDLMAAAKEAALAMAQSGHQAKAQQIVQVAGPSGKAGLLAAASAELAAGRMTKTDFQIAETLAGVLTGGDAGDLSRLASEEALMALELDALMTLADQPTTRARMAHMLKTGKPLRN